MRPITIDTDTGVDDALAIILALKSSELSVEAITTVAGNVEVEKCTRNCLLLLDILQPTQVPIVAQGAKKPLMKELVTAPEVHGEDGLGNVTSSYPPPRHRAVSENAVQVILDIVRKHPHELTIVALGPLTNLALAIEKDLKTMKKVREIIAMGGAFRVPGNTGPVAEFNMYVDPDAAQRVFQAGLPLTLVPLDVTEQVVLHRSKVLRMETEDPIWLGTFIARFTQTYMEYHKKTEGSSGAYLHDPLTVGIAIRANFVRRRDLHVEVKTEGKLTRGMSVADLRPSGEKRPSNARVAYDVRSKEFLQFFESRVWH